MNQSGRMEQTREALRWNSTGLRLPALAEVEEWETRLAEAEKLYGIFRARYEDKYTEWDAAKTNAVKDAMAEADRLKAALEAVVATDSKWIRHPGVEIARAALAPADRNTT